MAILRVVGLQLAYRGTAEYPFISVPVGRHDPPTSCPVLWASFPLSTTFSHEEVRYETHTSLDSHGGFCFRVWVVARGVRMGAYGRRRRFQCVCRYQRQRRCQQFGAQRKLQRGYKRKRCRGREFQQPRREFKLECRYESERECRRERQ